MKAPKAVEKVRVLVRTEVVRPRKAHAPTGSGLRTRPAMVEAKMESNCQACGVTSGGLGTTKRTMRPMERETINGITFAPSGGGFRDFESVGTGVFSADEELWGMNLRVL